MNLGKEKTMRLKKKTVKILSVLMSVIMLFTVCAPVIGAVDTNGHTNEEKDKLVYVSIGDSMTNGYGLDGYNGNSGIMNYAKNTYSNKFAAWLAGYTGKIEDDQVIFDGPLATVDHRQLAMSGMRAEDLHWALELDYENTEFMETIYNQWYTSNNWETVVKDLWFGEWGFKVGDFRTWTDLCDGDYRYADGAARILATYSKDENKGFFQSSYATEKEIQAAVSGIGKNQYYPENKNQCEQIGGHRYLQIATEFYQQSVKDADIISLALGNTNFGTFMLAAIIEVLSGPPEELEIFRNRYNVEDVFALAELDPELEQKIRDYIPQIEDFVHERFGVLTGSEKERMDALTNIILYCFSSYIVNYIGVVDAILAVNPDVQIIQVALMNAYADEIEGITETTLGDVVDFMYTPLNAFIAALPTYMQATGEPRYENARFYYAEADTVECMVHVFGDDYYKDAEGEFIGYPGFNVTDEMVPNLNSTARDRFLQYIRGSLLAPLAGSFGLSNPNALTIEDVVAYEQMSNAQKAAFAAVNRDMAMTCAFYLAFENALIKAGRGTVTLESLVMSAEIYDTKDFSVLRPVLEEFNKQVAVTGPAYAPDAAKAMAPIVEKTIENNINGMLASFGVSVDLTVTWQQVLAILADGDGSATEAVCKAIADQATKAVVDAVIPVYKAGVIAQAYSGIAGALKGYTVPAGIYGQEFAAGFDALNDAQKEAFLVKFAADYAAGLPTLGAVSALLAEGFLANADIKSAVLAVASIGEDQIAQATEAYVDGMLVGAGKKPLAENILTEISSTMPAQVKSSASSLCTLLAVPETLSAVMTEDEDATICSMLCMAARVLIGDGIGGHPSEGGHNALLEAIRDSYVNDYSSFDETVNNLRDFISEYYDEIYAYTYAEAEKRGLIDKLDARLDEAVGAIRYAEAWAFGYEEYFRSESFALALRASANDAVATVEALRDLVKNADRLDAETYGKAKALIEKLKNNLSGFAALLNTVAADASVYADEVLKPQIAEALALLNQKLNEVQEAAALLEAAVKEQIAVAEAWMREFAVLAQKQLAGFIGDGKNYLKSLWNEFVDSEFFAEYNVSADSFYLAIGDDTLYAEILADRLKLSKDRFGVMGWNDLDSSLIAKADLITVGYSESTISGFAVERMLGYVQSYMDADLREAIDNYASEALKHFLGNMKPSPDAAVTETIVGNVEKTVNDTLDGILKNEIFSDAKYESLDWAALIGEEYASYEETVRAAITEALMKAGVPEYYTFEIETAELLIENADLLDPSVAAMFTYFEPETIRAMFGDYAVFRHDIPVLDALVCALESYVYGYVKFNVEYARLVYAVNATNPDAQVILLGNYNAFADRGLDIVIGDLVLGLDWLPTLGLTDAVGEATDVLLGALDPAKVRNTVDTVFDELDARAAQAYAEIKAAQGYVTSIDFAEAVKAIDIPEIELAMLVGEENVALAKKLIHVVKYTLKEFGVCDGIMEKVPSVKETVLTFVAGAKEKADSAMENTFVQLGMTLSEARETAYVLSDYAAVLGERAQALQARIQALCEAVKALEITVKGTSFDLGNALGAPALAHSLLRAIADENAIFVDISEAQTVYGEGSITEFLYAYFTDRSVANVSEEGHAYIAERIYDSLTLTCYHLDGDNDHLCDYCEEILGVCEDGDGDHKCDLCGKVLGECEDKDNDHKCDLCEKVLGECEDQNKDHKCDLCEKVLGECEDENLDHKCDICEKVLSECTDENNDHICDVCGKKCSECVDDSHDHKCDICGIVMSECSYGEWVVTKEPTRKEDGERRRACTVCGAEEVEVIPELGLSVVAIVAISVGSVAAIAGVGVAVFWFVHKKKLAKASMKADED